MKRTLTEMFLASADRHAGRPALYDDGGVVRYAELAADVERFAGRLQELGLAGTRIGLLLPNLPLFPLVFYGAQRAACSTLLLNPASSRREIAEHLGAAEVATVITDEALAALLPHGTTALLADELPESVRISDGAEPRDLPLAGAPPVTTSPRRPDDEACVLFTAANDGWARGAVLSHENLVANLRSTEEAMLVGPEDCVVGALPYVHLFGLTVTLNAPISVGAALLPIERFRPPRVLDLLESRPATVLAGVPAIYIALLAAAERRPAPRHSLRLTICGGAPLPQEVAFQWEERFGLPLRQGYGLTEAGPVCLFNRVDRPNHPGALGEPFPAVEVSIRDLAGVPLPDGEVGEICVRGSNVFSGYLGDGGRRPGEFHGEWLRTGDLGTRDAAGVFRFHGMLKPMFTRNGFNVYPRELERVLQSEPGIERATVLALPDPHRENEIVVQLRLVDGSTLSEEEVREICRTRLAAYKQPTRVEIQR